MSLQINLQSLATRLATECKSLRTLLNGNELSNASLATTAKSSLILSINEVYAAVVALKDSTSIADNTTNSTTTWSSAKVAAAIAQAKSDLVNGSGAALDTLAELAAALGNDSNFASSTLTALGNRVRFDSPQTLTAIQQAQACANIGVGDPETSYVATFNSGLI